jgi:hypothetical protein
LYALSITLVDLLKLHPEKKIYNKIIKYRDIMRHQYTMLNVQYMSTRGLVPGCDTKCWSSVSPGYSFKFYENERKQMGRESTFTVQYSWNESHQQVQTGDVRFRKCMFEALASYSSRREGLMSNYLRKSLKTGKHSSSSVRVTSTWLASRHLSSFNMALKWNKA